jgi:hypothetical protein
VSLVSEIPIHGTNFIRKKLFKTITPPKPRESYRWITNFLKEKLNSFPHIKGEQMFEEHHTIFSALPRVMVTEKPMI